MARTGQVMRGRYSSIFQAKVWVQPDVVPAPKGRVWVGVIAGELVAQAGGFIRLLGCFDTPEPKVLHHYVRREENQATDFAAGYAGMDQRARATVSEAEQNRRLHAELVEKFGEGVKRLVVHEIDAARLFERIRVAVAIARINKCSTASGVDAAAGKVFPHLQGSEAFVEENEHRRMRVSARDECIFGPMPLDLEEVHSRLYAVYCIMTNLSNFRRSRPKHCRIVLLRQA